MLLLLFTLSDLDFIADSQQCQLHSQSLSSSLPHFSFNLVCSKSANTLLVQTTQFPIKKFNMNKWNVVWLYAQDVCCYSFCCVHNIARAIYYDMQTEELQLSVIYSENEVFQLQCVPPEKKRTGGKIKYIGDTVIIHQKVYFLCKKFHLASFCFVVFSFAVKNGIVWNCHLFCFVAWRKLRRWVYATWFRQKKSLFPMSSLWNCSSKRWRTLRRKFLSKLFLSAIVYFCLFYPFVVYFISSQMSFVTCIAQILCNAIDNRVSYFGPNRITWKCTGAFWKHRKFSRASPFLFVVDKCARRDRLSKYDRNKFM